MDIQKSQRMTPKCHPPTRVDQADSGVTMIPTWKRLYPREEEQTNDEVSHGEREDEVILGPAAEIPLPADGQQDEEIADDTADDQKTEYHSQQSRLQLNVNNYMKS